MTLVTLVTRNRTLEERDDLLKEITEAPIFTDPEEVSMTRRTRKKAKQKEGR